MQPLHSLRRFTTLLALAAGIIEISGVRLSAAAPVFQWSTLVGRASAGSEDGVGDKARFNAPQGVALDPVGNLYVADKNNHTIRKIAPDGTVTTLAGSPGKSGSADGTGAAARFNAPEGVAVDSFGAIFVADTGNHTIRKVSTTGVVTTLAGTAGTGAFADGPVAAALFKGPVDLGVDGSGILYVLDVAGIRRIMNGQVETIYQTGGTMTVPLYNSSMETATVSSIAGLAVARDGQIYFTVTFRLYSSGTDQFYYSPGLLKRSALGVVSLVQGGPFAFGSNNIYFGKLAVDTAGNALVLGRSGWEGAHNPVFSIRADGTGGGAIGSLHAANGADIEAHGIALNDAGDYFFSRHDNAIFRMAASAPSSGLFAGASEDALPFKYAGSIAIDAPGNIWVAMDVYASIFGRGRSRPTLCTRCSEARCRWSRPTDRVAWVSSMGCTPRRR
jgi:hypothetical protein